MTRRDWFCPTCVAGTHSTGSKTKARVEPWRWDAADAAESGLPSEAASTSAAKTAPAAPAAPPPTAITAATTAISSSASTTSAPAASASSPAATTNTATCPATIPALTPGEAAAAAAVQAAQSSPVDTGAGVGPPRRNTAVAGRRAASPLSSSAAAAPASKSKSKSESESEIESEIESWASRRAVRETLLRRARAQLHLASVPERLLSRDAQRGVVADFCCGRLDARRGGALYVCGSPGLGKSLTVRAAMAQLKEEASPAVRFAFFNASLCFEPSAVYAALLHELGGGSGGAASSVAAAKAKPAAGDPDAKALLEEMLAPAVAAGGAAADGAAGGGKRKRTLSTATHGAEGKGGGAMCVVALDEIDQLLNRQQDVLYQLFDWAAVPTLRLEPWPWPWHWDWHVALTTGTGTGTSFS